MDNLASPSQRTEAKIGLNRPQKTTSAVGHPSMNLLLRKTFRLYVGVQQTVCPLRAIRLFTEVDLVTIKEDPEGEYRGFEHGIVDGVVQRPLKRPVVALHYLFEFARNNKRTCSLGQHHAHV